ncbi:MAG: acyl-CoA/acyl-ACP dehydrogenase [Betaproteobacteria bacterium]|nr:acyl-CoA/acyl-ACP dehydrogenase [Betaproteobacteria bacterium]
MDFALSEEQRMMVDGARRMTEREFQPILDQNDPDEALPKPALLRIMAKAADLGILSARIPEEGGGAGLSMLNYGLIREQLPAPVMLMLQGQETTITRLYFGCNEEQKARFLPDLIAGRKIIAIGSTEPDGGSDPRGVRTSVTEEGDHLILNGRKQWITSASTCDVMLVTCRATNADGSKRFARVLVDRIESPFEARDIEMMGLRPTSLGEVLFDNCRVPKRNLCPDTVNTAGLLTVTVACKPSVDWTHSGQHGAKGTRRGALVCRDKKQFGRLIGAFQIIQQDLADIETAVVSSRLLCYYALAAIDRGERANGLSAMAKRYAVDSCDRAIALAMRIHGAIGLSRELGLERLARDMRTLSIPDGTPGILAMIQGRELTGIDPFRG